MLREIAIPFAAWALLIGSAPLARAAPPARPDVVLILIDTCRRDALGCYGNPRDTTPELDRFAEEGARFERAIATSPWTLPSTASIVTGRMPTVHGAYGQDRRMTAIRAGIPTLAEILAADGYRTAAIVNAPFLKPSFGFARGFRSYDFVPASGAELRRAGECVDAALRVLDSGADSPDFLLLHLFDPHMPYDPPEPFRERFDEGYRGSWEPPLTLHQRMMDSSWTPEAADYAYMRRMYDADVAYVSEQLGRFFDELRRRDVWGRTCVILASDHGEEFHEHGAWEHGHAHYEEVIQVPLLVKLPADARPARHVVEAQVSLLDIAPTVLDVAGVSPLPDGIEGASLVPLITSEAEPEDRVAASERNRREGDKVSIRDARFTWIRNREGTRRGELYDRTEDPHETRNLAAERPDDALALEARLADLLEAWEGAAAGLGAAGPIGPDPQLREQLESLGYTGDD